MQNNQHEVALREVVDEDRNFLLAVFASTRADELAALADTGMAESFVNMQFGFQQQSYRAAYPQAENSIIVLGDRAVGQMIVDRSDEGIRLVDIALLPEFRSQGFGSILLRRLIDEAVAMGKSVQLSVNLLNPAVKLYERLGFSKVGEEGLYIQMQCVAGQAAR